MRVKDWLKAPTVVREDTYDYEMAHSDVTEPVSPSAPLEPDVGFMDRMDPDAGEIRTLGGALDFFTNMVTDLVLPDETDTHAKGPRKSPKPVIDVVNRAATSWRGNTFNIGVAEGGVRIITERDDRIRAVVTNWGPGIAYLSAGTGGEIAGSNMVQIPVNGTREFRTADAVYAYPAVPGTTQVVDVQDEYGVPE